MSRKIGTLFIAPNRNKEFAVVQNRGHCVGYITPDGLGDWQFSLAAMAASHKFSPACMRDMHLCLESVRSNTNVK